MENLRVLVLSSHEKSFGKTVFVLQTCHNCLEKITQVHLDAARSNLNDAGAMLQMLTEMRPAYEYLPGMASLALPNMERIIGYYGLLNQIARQTHEEIVSQISATIYDTDQ